MLLREFKMIGMGSPHVGMIGHSPYQDMDHGHDDMEMVVHKGGMGHKGSLSMEDCCKAVLCLIECCDCEITKKKIADCCQDILASC
tara:strand:+ start:190 stop:447 length:258 start_codon:yes stop_codon:yes gene_type:complete